MTLEALCDRSNQSAEISDEPMVEGCQSMETSEIMQGLWHGPYQDHIYLRLIFLNTISINHKTKESDRSSEKGTLLLIDKQALRPKHIKNFTEVVKM